MRDLDVYGRAAVTAGFLCSGVGLMAAHDFFMAGLGMLVASVGTIMSFLGANR